MYFRNAARMVITSSRSHNGNEPLKITVTAESSVDSHYLGCRRWSVGWRTAKVILQLSRILKKYPVFRFLQPSPDVVKYIGFPGELFMNMLKAMILPLIVASLISGLHATLPFGTKNQL